MSETVNTLAEHFDVVWKVLGVVTAALYFVVRFVFRDYKRRIEDLELKLVQTTKEIEKRMTIVACGDARNKCVNAVLLTQLTDSMEVIKKAVIILIMHSQVIPRDEKDRIAKELV